MSGFKKFYVSTQDTSKPEQLQRTINTLQQNVEQSLTELNKVSILNNVTYHDVVINTTNTLSHKLGRAPVGYIIIQKNANANIWNGAITESTISLVSSAAVTVSIMVF